MNKQFFLNEIKIKNPKSRIDHGINSILDNFYICNLNKIFDIFDLSNFNDKIYNIQDINLIYYFAEFQIYLVQILLDNPHLLNNYFNSNLDFYKLYHESTCYFIIIKLKLNLFTKLKPKKKFIIKFKKYLGYIDKLLDFDINKYQDFFQKDLDYDKKKEILLSIYDKSLKKMKKNIFLLFWIIEEDIKYSILDKYEDINDYEKFNHVEEISDIFLENKILPNKITEIEKIQNKFKVIDNYKLFKENILSL